MSETIEVFVNGNKTSLYQGMQVKHALIAYDQNLYFAAISGGIRVEDEHGFDVGLEGALSDGARLFTISLRG